MPSEQDQFRGHPYRRRLREGCRIYRSCEGYQGSQGFQCRSKAWEAEAALRAAERANKPVKVKGPNPEAEARRQALDAQVASLPSFTDYTATDIMNALAGQIADNVTVMAVGSSAMRLVEKGVLSMTLDEKKKKHYTKG